MEDIDQQPQGRSNSRSLRVAGIFLLILLILGGMFYGIYQRQRSQVANLERDVAQLNEMLTDAQKQAPVVQSKDDTTYVSRKGVVVKVYVPTKGTTLKNPLIVLGEVPGSWSFEASFPVILKDSRVDVIAQAPAQILGEWTTNELVPFSVILPYASSVSGDGVLVLQRDNPSGLTENDDSIVIPVKY
ncbi:hypothetical protein H7100_00140 [Candidatus Saccharibacteria bacterium]|nr:hypothetical protein [Candidatus Saccharibacteria bacterium]